MAGLLYGSGLRLMECVRLRVKDVDFGYGQVTVRDGKGEKDRRTVLPGPLASSLERQLAWSKRLHEGDLGARHGAVYLPYARPSTEAKDVRTYGPSFSGKGCLESLTPPATRARPAPAVAHAAFRRVA